MKNFISIYLFTITGVLFTPNCFAIETDNDTGCIYLNGIEDRIVFDNTLNLSQEFTISMWVKIDAARDSQKFKTIIGKTDGLTGWSIGLNQNNQISIKYNFLNLGFTSNSYLNVEVWREITLSYNGATLSLYIDGILDNTTTLKSTFKNNSHSLVIGAILSPAGTLTKHFRGSMDELRIWNKALSQEQIRSLMNQELVEYNNIVIGSITPDKTDLSWNDLQAYYNFNEPVNTPVLDTSLNPVNAIPSISKFSRASQTAPLPYQSISNGNWNDDSTWSLQGTVHAPNSTRVIDGKQVVVDWNIVRTDHDVNITESTTIKALIIDQETVHVKNDQLLTITNYFKLNGILDLKDKSQLIQTKESILDEESKGTLERDQQGTGNTYSYNYWSSPVSISGQNSLNYGYTVESVMMDGTISSSPKYLNFTSPDIANGSPATNNQAATISSKWMYKYSNLASGIYANWQFVGNEGNLKAGEAFTMKGTGTTGDQNYTFKGMPNNGDIELSANEGNDYLIGNPYPSAIDASQFIQDNPLLDGTIYFWEHLEGDSHALEDYEGGYSMYNLSGGAPTATIGTANPLTNRDGSTISIPGKYIPVAQGFFVIVKNNGTIKFNNDQRRFKNVDNSNNNYFAAPNADHNRAQATTYQDQSDDRPKIRIGFDSPNLIHRQLLLTVDPNATSGLDRGYDGIQFDDQIDDMAFLIHNERLSIQGIGIVDGAVELPLYVKLRDNGTIKIGIDFMENIDEDQPIFLKDNTTGILHDLREKKFESPFLFRGQYRTRFSIVFHGKSTLSNDSVDSNDSILVFTPANSKTLNIEATQDIQIEKVILTNMLGQEVKNWKISKGQNEIVLSRHGIATGNYIVTMESDKIAYNRKVMFK